MYNTIKDIKHLYLPGRRSSLCQIFRQPLGLDTYTNEIGPVRISQCFAHMKTLLKFFIYSFVLAASVQVHAQQTLLLVGGGARPPEALKEWLNGNKAAEPNVLIITWASESKKPDYEASLQRDLGALGVKKFLASRDITNAEERAEFLRDLPKATHIFFSGGSQLKIMSILNNDAHLMDVLQHAYWSKNIPVGGTSAGTSVQAELMITGVDGVLERGLGFLPKSVIDQHFFKRGREDRLRGYMKNAPENFVGIGVDEDGSLLLKRDPKTKKFSRKVIGDKNIMVIEPAVNHKRVEKILTPSAVNKCSGLF